ncbi:MAG TPA: hypothetical protein VGE02_05235 [Gemmatimonadales bacterium]
MPHSADWGMGWALLAYGVSWAVMLGYLHYVNSRVDRAREALTREEDY